MKQCLSEENTHKLILAKTIGIQFDIDDCELSAICDEAEMWQLEVIILNYFVTRTLEKLQKKEEPVKILLNDIIRLADKMFIKYQTFDRDYVDLMMNSTRTMGTTLSENLILLQERLSRHAYK